MKVLVCIVAFLSLCQALECPLSVREESEKLIADSYGTDSYATVMMKATSMPGVCTRKCVPKGERRVAGLVEQHQVCMVSCCEEAFQKMKEGIRPV